MTGYFHLFPRGAADWSRRRVPTELLAEFRNKEWKRSLETRDLEELSAASIAASWRPTGKSRPRGRLAYRVAAPLTDMEARNLAVRQLARWLGHDQKARLLWRRDVADNAEVLLFEFADDFRRALAEGAGGTTARQAEGLLADEGRWRPPEDPASASLAGELLCANVQFYDAIERRQAGEIAPERLEMALVGPTAVCGLEIEI